MPEKNRGRGKGTAAGLVDMPPKNDFETSRQQLVVNFWYSGGREKYARRKGRTLGGEDSPLFRLFGYSATGSVFFAFGLVFMFLPRIILSWAGQNDVLSCCPDFLNPDVMVVATAGMAFACFVFSLKWFSFAWSLLFTLLFGGDADMNDEHRMTILRASYEMFGEEKSTKKDSGVSA